MLGKPRTITAYCLQWHIERSSAFVDALVDPLKPYADIRLTPWDGQSSLSPPPEAKTPIFFCLLPPPLEWLLRFPERLIWIPMWDGIRSTRQKWWNALPKTLRIVAFSDSVYQRAKMAGLPTLRAHFHKDPASVAPASWPGERTLLYWNRTGLLNAAMLERLCEALRIDRLLFRPDIDERVDPAAYYTLPGRLGSTQVENIGTFTSREAYFVATRAANIFIAPRSSEGIGMAFLEALARGCAVLAANAPTMNEYIVSGRNGHLLMLPPASNPLVRTVRQRLIHRGLLPAPPFKFGLLAENQNWAEISALSPETLGDQARIDAQAAHQQWLRDIPEYAYFTGLGTA